MNAKIEEMAIAKFERKMSLPQYGEYKNNEEAQAFLMRDCIREAIFEKSSLDKALDRALNSQRKEGRECQSKLQFLSAR